MSWRLSRKLVVLLFTALLAAVAVAAWWTQVDADSGVGTANTFTDPEGQTIDLPEKLPVIDSEGRIIGYSSLDYPPPEPLNEQGVDPLPDNAELIVCGPDSAAEPECAPDSEP